VNSELGPDGPGYYLVGGGRTVKIEPPRDQTCGWVCSVGFATTQVLGCKSEKGCIVQGALFVSPIPPTKGLRLLKASSKLRRALNLIRKARKAERAVEAAKGARFVVNAAGETILRVRAGSKMIAVSEHAAKRMTQRGISIDAVEEALTRKPFKYFHERIWKTGYYNAGTRVFVARVGNTVRTVIKANPKYIKNLKATRP
jgi:hypothetical protein